MTMMKSTVSMLALSWLVCCCGSEKKEPAPEDLAAAAAEALGMDPASGAGWIEFGGVGYELAAKALPRGDGKSFGVEVKVVAEATDDAEHAIVQDKMEPADTGPIALWLSGSLARANGDSSAFSESVLTSNKDVRVVEKGRPATFERSYPDPVHPMFKNENDPGPPVTPGDKLELEVGLLGLENPKGAPRTSPKLFTVTLNVSAEGKPSLSLDPAKPPAPAAALAAEGEIAGHAVSVRPFTSEDVVRTATSKSGIARLSAGTTTVRVHEGHLMVGYRYFGTLPEGAPIEVDGEQVRVAGEERAGQDLAAAELLKLFPFAAAEEVLAGHRVRVIPTGATAVMGAAGSELFIVGDTKIEIEHGSLKVGDKPYGKLAPRAAVEVLFGKVLVNGRAREPIGE